MTNEQTLLWTPFECDGRSFEYAVVLSAAHHPPVGAARREASPVRSAPVVLVMVRNAGAEIGPAMVYAEGTIATIEHAIEAARFFWEQLT